MEAIAWEKVAAQKCSAVASTESGEASANIIVADFVEC